MTDLERFIELYRSVGIDLTPKPADDAATTGNLALFIGDDVFEHDRMSHAPDERLRGYSGFYVCIEFSPEGKFLRQGAYE